MGPIPLAVTVPADMTGASAAPVIAGTIFRARRLEGRPGHAVTRRLVRHRGGLGASSARVKARRVMRTGVPPLV